MTNRELFSPQLVRRAFAVVLAFASISAITTLPAADAKNADSVVTVTEADNGKDVDLTTGQTLQVKLKSIPGTGYAWTLDGDPAPLKLTKSFSQRSKNTTGMAGAPQMSVFQLSANSAGVATLTFIYRRAWEYDVAPAKTFSIRVNVR